MQIRGESLIFFFTGKGEWGTRKFMKAKIDSLLYKNTLKE